jgi:hypothetical protein
MPNNKENELISQLKESANHDLNVGKSRLFDAAAIKIAELESKLQKAVNERNEAWFQLEENSIEIRPTTVNEE